jgi:hypothetical protein
MIRTVFDKLFPALVLFLATCQIALAEDDARNEVRRLVRQLNAPQLAQREAAETALLARGPSILRWLPASDDQTSAEVQQRLERIRQRLQQAASDRSTDASLLTLHAKDSPLSAVLQDLQKQSGNVIVDYRKPFGQPTLDISVTFDCNQTTFWPTFDQLLDSAGLTVYPYGRAKAISVVAASKTDKSVRNQQASYRGPFRFAPLSIVAKRDLQAQGAGSLRVTLEVMWEPRIQVLKLQQRMADVVAIDDRGQRIPVADPTAQPEITVGNDTTAVKLDVPLQLPSREARRIARLEGKLLATLGGKVETFRFSELSNVKNAERRIANATVTVEEVRKTPQGVEVRMRARFDDAGDALASHRQWIFSNPAFLESADGKPVAFENYETIAQSKNEVALVYSFTTGQPIDRLTFVYQTPGSIVTRGFEYRQKEIELP